MSVCAHAFIGPRHHVTVDLKKGLFAALPLGHVPQHFPLYNFSVLKKGGYCFTDYKEPKVEFSVFIIKICWATKKIFEDYF